MSAQSERTVSDFRDKSIPHGKLLYTDCNINWVFNDSHKQSDNVILEDNLTKHMVYCMNEEN